MSRKIVILFGFGLTVISVSLLVISVFGNSLDYRANINLSEYGVVVDSNWSVDVRDKNISDASIRHKDNNYVLFMDFKKIGTNIVTIANGQGKSYQFLVSANKNRHVDIVEDN